MISTEIAPYPILSSGVDWLSIRTKEFDVANAYDALAFEVFKAAKESGEKIENAVRVGFAGRAASGIFLGHKESTSLLTLSSEVARKYAPVALKLGGSVARIDLQVTIDTRRDKPNLASRSYFQAKVVPSKGGRPRELKLTQTHPAGDTLNVNKRTSTTTVVSTTLRRHIRRVISIRSGGTKLNLREVLQKLLLLLSTVLTIIKLLQNR
jgi:hypothetical protein